MSFGTLTIVFADGRHQTIALDRPLLRIGRAADNDLVIDEPSVSSYHARVTVDAAGISLLDIGSRNGTEVDGRRIDAATLLAAESQIRIGRARLRYTPAGSPVPAADDDFGLPPFPDDDLFAPPPTAVAAGGTTTAAAAASEGPPLVRLDLQPESAIADLAAGLNPAMLSFVAEVQNISRFVDQITLELDWSDLDAA
jgi:predicted component of type VI protein secretion system